MRKERLGVDALLISIGMGLFGGAKNDYSREEWSDLTGKQAVAGKVISKVAQGKDRLTTGKTNGAQHNI